MNEEGKQRARDEEGGRERRKEEGSDGGRKHVHLMELGYWT